ncbi:protein FRA10AC1 [Pelomyxa schiedti]|nr:protein FRA10AC1 [Pelomyxa schiedti]
MSGVTGTGGGVGDATSSSSASASSTKGGVTKPVGSVPWKYMNAYERHQKYVNDYMKYYSHGAPLFPSGAERRATRTDEDVLRENYRFLPNEEDLDQSSWEKRMVKHYYDKLYREYCLADLSRYTTGQVGLRWRTQKELLQGKGQFICGAKGCPATQDLCSYEVMFDYKEAGERKQALVKLRVCPECAKKLNFKRELKRAQKEEKKAHSKHSHKHRTHSTDDAEATSSPTSTTPTSPTSTSTTPSTSAAADRPTSSTTTTSSATTSSVHPPTAVEVESSAHEILPTTGNEWKTRPEMEKSNLDEFEDYFAGMFP